MIRVAETDVATVVSVTLFVVAFAVDVCVVSFGAVASSVGDNANAAAAAAAATVTKTNKYVRA